MQIVVFLLSPYLLPFLNDEVQRRLVKFIEALWRVFYCLAGYWVTDLDFVILKQERGSRDG